MTTTQTIRHARLERTLPGWTGLSGGDELGDDTGAIERYVLIESSTVSSVQHVSDHTTIYDALTYFEDQADPTIWEPLRLIDLDLDLSFVLTTKISAVITDVLTADSP